MGSWHVYVGGLTQDVWKYFPNLDPGTTIPSAGIECFLFNDVTGSLHHIDTTTDLRSPQYLRMHPHLPVLYAAEFTGAGRIVSLIVQPDGRLTRQSAVNSLGVLPIAIDTNPDGTVAYVAHLGDGTISACPLDRFGALFGAHRITSETAEEGGSQVHHVRVTRSGKAVVATDFGRDEVLTYAVGPKAAPSTEPIARVRLPSGSKPRHIEFHPSGRTVYVVGEHDCRIYVLGAEDDIPRNVVSSHGLTPPGYQGDCSISELELHPDGRTLFVGVRKADCIAVLSVDGYGGVETLHHEPSRGHNPRALRIAPSGNHLLIGNWHSNQVVIFGIEGGRHLRPIGEPVSVPSPSSLLFRPTPS